MVLSLHLILLIFLINSFFVLLLAIYCIKAFLWTRFLVLLLEHLVFFIPWISFLEKCAEYCGWRLETEWFFWTRNYFFFCSFQFQSSLNLVLSTLVWTIMCKDLLMVGLFLCGKRFYVQIIWSWKTIVFHITFLKFMWNTGLLCSIICSICCLSLGYRDFLVHRLLPPSVILIRLSQVLWCY